MRNIVSIMIFTIRELCAQKVIAGTGILFVLLMVLVTSTGHFQAEEQIKVVQDAGIGFFSFFAMIVLLFCVPFVLSRALQSRTTEEMFLTKPVGRGAFLCGRVAGVAVMLLGGLMCAAACFVMLVFVRFGQVPSGMVQVLYVLVLKYFAFLPVIVLFAICFDMLMTSFLGVFSFFMANAVAFLGHDEHGGEAAVSIVAQAIKLVLPRFELYNVITAVTFDQPISILYLMKVTGYSVVYALVVYALAYAVYRRREL